MSLLFDLLYTRHVVYNAWFQDGGFCLCNACSFFFFPFLFFSFFSARVMHDGRGGQRVGRGREEGSRQTLVLEGEGVGREREKIESERDTLSTFLLALLAGNYFIAV